MTLSSPAMRNSAFRVNDVVPTCDFLRVRYGECDAQKVVFNARYGDYVDVAVNEFFRALGLGEALINGDLDFQLVKQTLEWTAPARFDQVLGVSLMAVIDLVADDEGDDLTDEERRAPHEALAASWKSAEAGRLRPASAILDELRQRR
jgi:hypothetical protein